MIDITTMNSLLLDEMLTAAFKGVGPETIKDILAYLDDTGQEGADSATTFYAIVNDCLDEPTPRAKGLIIRASMDKAAS